MPEIISVDTRELDKLARAFKKAPEATTSLLSKGIDASMAIMAKYTIKDNPVPYKFGFLLASFRFDKISKLSARWYPTVKYAGFVDQGTAHITPRYYMKAIADKATPEVQRMFDGVVEKISKEIIK